MSNQLPDVGTKVFVLSEDSFSYDDNYYSRVGDGGSPVAAFRTKERAEKEAIDRLVGMLRGEYFELSDYGEYPLDAIFWGNRERLDLFCDIYEVVNPDDASRIRNNDYNYEVVGRFKRSFALLNEDDKRTLASYLFNFFFSITEVEVTE